jgi:hypothetical protein
MGVFPRLVTPPLIPVDAGTTAAIVFVPSALCAVFSPLLGSVCGDGPNCREELVGASGASQEVLPCKFRSSASFCFARALVNKEVELDREEWAHGRLLL